LRCLSFVIDPPSLGLIVQAEYARYRRSQNSSGEVAMSGPADESFGAHPFAEIARATVAAQERSLELAQAWLDSLRELVVDQAEGGRAALEGFATTTQAQLELTRAFLVPLGVGGDQSEAFGSLVQGWNDAFLRLLEATPGVQPRRRQRD
jgi:hypothetical protein